MIREYAINESRTLVTNDNYLRLINKVDNMDERLNFVEETPFKFLFRLINTFHEQFTIIARIDLYLVGASLKNIG